MDPLLAPLTLAAALGCALMGGLFFAFSNFVMGALARIAPASGIAAMQSINVVVLNPLFLALFFGTGALCLLLVVIALARWPAIGSGLLLAGGVLYLLGNLGVTVACNVPRNHALARVDASDGTAADAWHAYVAGWTRWNHVRTFTGLAAAALLGAALRRLPVIEA